MKITECYHFLLWQSSPTAFWIRGDSHIQEDFDKSDSLEFKEFSREDFHRVRNIMMAVHGVNGQWFFSDEYAARAAWAIYIDCDKIV